MTTHGSVAKTARLRKEAHPELYCPVQRCLWHTGGGYCPNHIHLVAEPMVLSDEDRAAITESLKRNPVRS